jgi:hypothetical protein
VDAWGKNKRKFSVAWLVRGSTASEIERCTAL